MHDVLDWQVANDDDEWEPVEGLGRPTGRRTRSGAHQVPRRLRLPRWFRIVGIAAVVVLAGAGALRVRLRYLEAERSIAFQIQSVMDLEAQALERGDTARYLAQQDETMPLWVARQGMLLENSQASLGASARGYDYVTVEDVWRARCPSEMRAASFALGAALDDTIRCPAALPAAKPTARLEKVEVRGDIAWVQVVTPDGSVRHARFYRRTPLGWKHTSPRAAFWGDLLTVSYGPVIVRAHERDLPHIATLVEHVALVLRDGSSALGLSPDRTLEVTFSIDEPTESPPRWSGEQLILASPWLSGMPANGIWDQAYLKALTYWTAYALASQMVRAGEDGSLNALQRALVDEYAVLYSREEISQVPILGRVVARHGAHVLPEVLTRLQTTGSTREFVGVWLAPPDAEPELSYDPFLLDVTRGAAALGRMDTFDLGVLLLEDRGRR